MSDKEPISGLCIISDHTRCPTGYMVIRKAYDDPTHEADLQRDGLFRRIDRYLCVTRYPFENVVEDVLLIGGSDVPPPGYMPLNLTVDTQEKSLSKKNICVKMSRRVPGRKAIGDIIFLARSKRPPPGYSLIGDVNGLLMCYKELTINDALKTECTSNSSTSEKTNKSQSNEDQYEAFTLQRQEEDFNSLLLAGVPFEVSAKLLSSSKQHAKDSSYKYLSPEEIDEKYNYDFKLERAWLS